MFCKLWIFLRPTSCYGSSLALGNLSAVSMDMVFAYKF